MVAYYFQDYNGMCLMIWSFRRIGCMYNAMCMLAGKCPGMNFPGLLFSRWKISQTHENSMSIYFIFHFRLTSLFKHNTEIYCILSKIEPYYKVSMIRLNGLHIISENRI